MVANTKEGYVSFANDGNSYGSKYRTNIIIYMLPIKSCTFGRLTVKKNQLCCEAMDVLFQELFMASALKDIEYLM